MNSTTVNTSTAIASNTETSTSSSPKTTFGILYTTLHCPMISNNGL